MAFMAKEKDVWDYESARDDTPPLTSKWRVLHLLGNAWVHNTLVELEKAGLTMSELRFFLCRDVPKRKQIHPRLREVRVYLSDEPALAFHIPPYNTRAQLAADLKELESAGYLRFHDGEWCLRSPAYEYLVNEWETERDVDLLRKYRGEDLIRVNHHVRLYGLPRTLLSEDEVQQLAEIAKTSSQLLARALKIQHRAKVRAWTEARRLLESGSLPKSVSGRILNQFLLWKPLDWAGPDRVWHPDTPRLISMEMFRIKQSQLLRRSMKRTIDDETLFDTTVQLGRKYLDYSSLPKASEVSRDTVGLEIPERASEPEFSSADEEALFRDLLEYVCDRNMAEGARSARLQELIRCGTPEALAGSLRALWRSSKTCVTLVSTSPTIPLEQEPTFWRMEKEFYDLFYSADEKASVAMPGRRPA